MIIIVVTLSWVWNVHFWFFFCLFIYRLSLSIIIAFVSNIYYYKTFFFSFYLKRYQLYVFFCFFLCRPDCILGFSPVINHLWICPHVLYCIILNAVHRNPYYSWENIGEILFIFQFFMSGLDVCIYFIFTSFLFWIQTVMCFSILFYNCIFRIILVANIC